MSLPPSSRPMLLPLGHFTLSLEIFWPTSSPASSNSASSIRMGTRSSSRTRIPILHLSSRHPTPTKMSMLFTSPRRKPESSSPWTSSARKSPNCRSMTRPWSVRQTRRTRRNLGSNSSCRKPAALVARPRRTVLLALTPTMIFGSAHRQRVSTALVTHQHELILVHRAQAHAEAT